MRVKRASLILVSFFLFAIVIIGRLAYLQIERHDFYTALAQGQQRFFIKIEGKRGEVFFRYGQPLAINRTFFYVFASPPEIENSEKTAYILNQALALPQNFILERITRKNSFFELLKNRLTQDEIKRLKELNLPGIYFGKEILRYYPQNFLASQVIGFVGGKGKGQYGIENYYNEFLRGEKGYQKGKRDVWGQVLGEIIEGGGSSGYDIVLTIDYNIQFVAEKLLKNAQKNYNIKSGQIIVMNPISGEILAMANFPNFNPNEFSQFYNLGIFKNPAVQKIFEPGSVMKVFTMAIALEEEKITPETTYIDTGEVRIGPHIIRNFDHRVFGERTMAEVLAKSINTGSIYAAKLVGLDVFVRYLERFGFFDLTGIDLQGEIAFSNQILRQGREINLATASFGQGISITPIQLARALSVIANNGKMVEPHIVKKIIDKNGKRIKKTEQRVGYEQIISPGTAHQLTTMLVGNVEHRFGKRARIPGYYAAGKTGTAHIPWAALGYNKPGYSNKLIHTFMGFAPAYNPQFLIIIKLDQPQGVRFASASAAPIFQELARYIINLWKISPDYGI
jgi:cell division protein FtsI/penicillin-binding protein 2